MDKINLLYVITKLELGGAQKQLLSLINHLGLDKERFNLFLLTACDGLLLEEASSITGLTVKRARFLERPINPLKDLLAFIEIYGFIKRNKIKIVHTHSSKAGIVGRWAARLAQVKIIIHTVHGWSFNDYQLSLIRSFFIWLERITARFTDIIIVVNHFDKIKGLSNGIGDENKYRIIRYGIDYSVFCIKDNHGRKELGLAADDFVVGMVACFKPQKFPEDFIKLAAMVNATHPHIKFLLVGNGILMRKIEKLIEYYNLRDKVILTGWRRDIPEILSAIDVFVLTSLWEGLPISVLEAMAASLPVVATNTGGIAEVIIDGKTGFLVKPQDTKHMSEKLLLLINDENLRRKMGENAKNNLDFNFTLQNMLKNTQDLYLGLFSKKLCHLQN